MPKYMLEASYTADGVKGLLKEGGSGRRDAVEKLVGSLGGKVEAFYFVFGKDDVIVIADLPDNTAAAAASLVASAGGGAHATIRVLLTAAEIDAATKQRADYRAPGG